ncbi:MAG TPA: DNA replication/repair protein RecF [bacterium]|nr:DNA replication/repair protein RecF [bacterium]
MWLAELRLRDFRNYAHLDLAFDRGMTALVGANAQGKSNLLEAVYTVSLGRSPRASADVELVRFGQDRAYVRAEVREPRGDVLEVAVDRATGEKRLKVNGVVVRRGQLLGRMAVVLAGPLDGEVVRGAPGARRRVLDAALSQASPSYYFTLTRYLRVVRQRNRLLGEGAAGSALEPWDEQLVTLGATLIERRRVFVRALAGRAALRHARIAGGAEQLDIAYACTADLPGEEDTGGTGDDRAVLARALARYRGEELRRRTSLAGPHRDDLRITVNGIDLRTFGSRGQQHTAALSVRLAEAELLREELGTWPVLLLDDVLADLDAARQISLLREVAGPQIVLTHTAPLPDAGAPLRTLVVRGGAVQPAADVRA